MSSLSTSVRGRSAKAAPPTAKIGPPRTSMALYRVRVVRVVQLSPNLRRVSLVAPELARLPYAGPDQRIKLLLPRPGQDRPQVDGLVTIHDFFALPADVRPIMRTYTIRNHRPAAAEVDLDFAQHGALGPASRWAAAAQPGDEVAIFGPASEHAPPEDTQWQLIVADESGLPAVGAIVESLRHYDRAHVIVELADGRDAQQFETAGVVEVRWLVRGSTPAHESTALLDAVRALDLPPVPSYFWLAGESSVITRIRRHLVNERAVSRDDVHFTGYWRHGLSENDA